jgi:hypothetical protein
MKEKTLPSMLNTGADNFPKISKADIKKFLLTKGEGKMANVVDRINRFFQRNVSPILIMGESGSGKEYIAKILLSDGKEFMANKYSAINCADMDDSLLRDDLFGHEIGAFTGANKKRDGLIKSVFNDKGSKGIFLDEIDKSSRPFQNALLRFIREGEVRAVGSDGPEIIRQKGKKIVFATTLPKDHIFFYQILSKSSNEPKTLKDILQDDDREEKQLIPPQIGPLSPDFLNRIKAFTIQLPPLRDRKEDLGLITAYLFDKLRKEINPDITEIDSFVIQFILNYSWRFNIPELEGFIANGMAASPGNILLFDSCLQYFPSMDDFIHLIFPDAYGAYRELTIKGYYTTKYLDIQHHSPQFNPDSPFTQAFKPFDTGRSFKMKHIETIMDNLFYLNRIELEQNSSEPERPFDYKKVNEYFNLKVKAKTEKEVWQKLGFDSSRPFKNWLKRQHLDPY